MKYFVLKPKGSDAYAVASRAAIVAYADEIRKHNPELSDELHNWVIDERMRAVGLASREE